MTKRQIYATFLTIFLASFLRVPPALALGDKVVTHVVDGGDSGLGYRTKFDISNLGYYNGTPITKLTVFFYRDNGAPWIVSIKDPVTGNTVSVSSLPLNFGTSQTVRIETLGTGSFGSGFAVVRNLDRTTDLPDDYEIAITVYYEVLQNGNVIDTVSVPIGLPTVSFSFPVEIDKTRTPWLSTGFAIVNLTDTANTVSMYLYETKSPLSGDAALYPQSAQIVLSSGQIQKKTARFLHEADFFPNVTRFKGMAIVSAQGPVSILALLQTPTATGGVQYATLEPAYLDSLRRNTLMYLPQGYFLDADLPAVDYYYDETWTPTDAAYKSYYRTSFDLLLETVGVTGRRLTPQPGAMIAPIGIKQGVDFDGITIEDLRNPSLYNYTTNSINLADGSTNLQEGFTFAIRTGLGRYVKARIRSIITYSQSSYKDLTLEIYVFK